MRALLLSTIFTLFCGFYNPTYAQNNTEQKVGIVLSGGGATGFAHIGFLKALEENNIPIDYITGTSAGALIGGLYASGYSPEEIEAFAKSDLFKTMVNGEIEFNYQFYYNEDDPDASMFKVRFRKDSLLRSTLPTNFTKPDLIDFEMLRLLGDVAHRNDNNYDSLLVPFRCVASDVTTKKSVVFDSGPLNESVRASMTYPFFITPIYVDGKLLFDGGLYNNFPADVLYEEFSPDYIIGSNVSSNEPPPQQHDVLSQITNMLVRPTNFSLPCHSGYIVKHESDLSTFDFDKIDQAIQKGYENTLKKIDSIKNELIVQSDPKALKQKREQFKKSRPVIIDSIKITGLNKKGAKEFVYNSFIQDKDRDKGMDILEFKKRYFRILTSRYVRFMFPKLIPNTDSSYIAEIFVAKEKDFSLRGGGILSSMPVSTGYLGIQYQNLSSSALAIDLNGYFGKFYTSFNASVRLDLPSKTPVFVEPSFTLNRWDFFKNFNTFFQDERPSYIIQNDLFFRFKTGLAAGNKGKITFDFSYSELNDSYYQTDNFTKLDTADRTTFDSYSLGVSYRRSTLNRKQFASAGTFLGVYAKYISGKERTIPGSTSFQNFEQKRGHNWFYVKLKYINYFWRKGVYRLGIDLEGVYSNKTFFSNYTSSLLSAPTYFPIPDSKTFYLDDFRAHQYLSAGLMNVFTFWKEQIDVRLEAYYYQPIQRIVSNEFDEAVMNPAFQDRFYIASASVIYHSFIGPLRVTAAYFNGQEKPWNFHIGLGFIIFNERALYPNY